METRESPSAPEKGSSQDILNSPEREKEKPYLTLFVGPEGSGKSTQGKMFAQAFHLPFVEAGQAFRDLKELDKKSSTELSKKASELSGYAGWDLFKDVMKWRFDNKIVDGKPVEEDYSKGFVLDGAPRTLEQFEKFDELMKELGFDNPIRMVFIHVPRRISKERLMKREMREETASDDVRLDMHYKDLDKKVKITKEKGWEFYSVITRSDQTKTPNLVHREILEKMNKLNRNWRKYVQLDSEINFEEVWFDISNASNSEIRLKRIEDYLENVNDTLSETSNTGEWFQGMNLLKEDLEFRKEKILASKLKKSNE